MSEISPDSRTQALLQTVEQQFPLKGSTGVGQQLRQLLAEASFEKAIELIETLQRLDRLIATEVSITVMAGLTNELTSEQRSEVAEIATRAALQGLYIGRREGAHVANPLEDLGEQFSMPETSYGLDLNSENLGGEGGGVIDNSGAQEEIN